MTFTFLVLFVAFAVCALVEFELFVREGSQQIDMLDVPSSVIQVNGEFPAPTLSAMLNDDVVVVVHNYLEQATTVHFHGIRQYQTNHMELRSFLSFTHEISIDVLFFYFLFLNKTTSLAECLLEHNARFNQICRSRIDFVLIRPARTGITVTSMRT